MPTPFLPQAHRRNGARHEQPCRDRYLTVLAADAWQISYPYCLPVLEQAQGYPIVFDGRCDEALEFYKQTIGASRQADAL